MTLAGSTVPAGKVNVMLFANPLKQVPLEAFHRPSPQSGSAEGRYGIANVCVLLVIGVPTVPFPPLL